MTIGNHKQTPNQNGLIRKQAKQAAKVRMTEVSNAALLWIPCMMFYASAIYLGMTLPWLGYSTAKEAAKAGKRSSRAEANLAKLRAESCQSVSAIPQ